MAALWITEKIGMIRAQGKYWEEGHLQWKRNMGWDQELKNFAKLCLAAECFWVGVTGLRGKERIGKAGVCINSGFYEYYLWPRLWGEYSSDLAIREFGR